MKRSSRLPRKFVEVYVLSSMGMSGTRHTRPKNAPDLSLQRYDEIEQSSLRTYMNLLSEGMFNIPLGVVYDLRCLVEYGYEVAFISSGVEGLQTSVRQRYENEVLNRISKSSSFSQALEILHMFRNNDSDEACFNVRADRLTYLVARTLHEYFPESLRLNAAHVRNVNGICVEDAGVLEALKGWEEYRNEKGDIPSWEEVYTTFVERVTGVVPFTALPVQWSDIVDKFYLSELEHYEELNQEYLRMTFRDVLKVKDSVKEVDFSRIEVQEEQSEADTNFIDKQSHATGGVSGICNKGRLQSLVPSQYMFRGLPLYEGSKVDLFSYKYSKKELLYYERDSGELNRKRRKAVFVVDMTQSLEVKFLSQPYQIATLVYGMILSIIRDLSELFLKDSMIFELVFTGVSGEDDLKQVSILTLLLDAYIKRDLLTFHVQDDYDVESAGLADRKTYCVYFSKDERNLKSIGNKVEALKDAATPLWLTPVNLTGKDVKGVTGQYGVVDFMSDETSVGSVQNNILDNIANIKRLR